MEESDVKKTKNRIRITGKLFALMSIFCISLLIVPNVSSAIAYHNSTTPRTLTLTEARQILLKNLPPGNQKSLPFTNFLVYLCLFFLNFIMIFSESGHLLLSLIASLIWPITDVYAAFALLLVFIVLWIALRDFPQLPHQTTTSIA